MWKYSLSFVVVVTVSSCSMSGVAALDRTQTWRIYRTSTGALFDAVHRFSQQEHFSLLRFEQEAGRILGEQTEQDTILKKQRVVLMAMAITQLDSVRCVIDARFNFANENRVYNVHDEQILIGYFRLLFGYLDTVFRSS